jgi:hypothetical protein
MLLANATAPLITSDQPVIEKTLEQIIIDEASQAGVDGRLAVKVAFCESTLRQFDKETGEPLRGVHNPQDVGLFQINERFHLEASQKLGYDIYSLEGNIDYAVYLMKKDGLRHWKFSQPCWSQEGETIAKK